MRELKHFSDYYLSANVKIFRVVLLIEMNMQVVLECCAIDTTSLPWYFKTFQRGKNTADETICERVRKNGREYYFRLF